MSNIFLIGATGGIGSRLGPMLVAAGHTVTGLHRKPEQADVLQGKGIEPYQGDLMAMTAADFTEATKGHDIIVFSAGAAGSGPDRTTAIDGRGPVKLLEAARANGISRLYLVSAFMDARRDKPQKEGFEHYIKNKRQADNAVAASDLDWVIVRPGTLVSEDGDGRVNAGLAIPYGTVARGNVAAALACLIETPEIKREIIELTDGDTPVGDAVRSFIR
ncbi:SDR family oxidoreductase [Microbulbifer litoralis]|uniref:SDR family oxidoreductase n=1 Tax=Microbulbifer litoralis TaxID=2933965 RepID=UPI00202946F8|nr:SDR family oxidoreductase [Microbulbifer sp. GX H0434]